jgi:hypothetical protein
VTGTPLFSFVVSWMWSALFAAVGCFTQYRKPCTQQRDKESVSVDGHLLDQVLGEREGELDALEPPTELL